MPTITITNGDSVTRIAAAAGLAPDTVWTHASNARLKESRDHMDVLAVGDQLTVPDPEPKAEKRATGKRHRFRRHGVPMRFKLQLLDVWGKPRAGAAYRLLVDGETRTGTLDGEGVLSVFVPTTAVKGTLYVDGLELPVLFGELEPKGGLVGIQQRLTNMGYPCTGDAGQIGAATVLALSGFQRMAGLSVTGELDDATRAALHDYHRQQDKLAQRLDTASERA